MEKFILKIMEKRINFYTDSRLCISKFRKERKILKTIPCEIEYAGNFNQVLERENVVCYLLRDNVNVQIDKVNNNAFLSGREDDLFFADLVYLIMCMFANIFQYDNKYFLQASVVRYNKEDSVMFIGDPGSGKTTMAYTITKDKNGSFISNDNVLVGIDNDNLKTYVGTHIVQMRLGSLRLFFNEILEELEIIVSDRNEWDTKIYIDDILKRRNFNFSNYSNVKGIYFINCVPYGDTVIREREYIDKLLIMYEHLTKQIRSNRYLLTSFNKVIPSFEDEECMEHRLELARNVVDLVPIYEAKGDILKLVKKIEGNL